MCKDPEALTNTTLQPYYVQPQIFVWEYMKEKQLYNIIYKVES